MGKQVNWFLKARRWLESDLSNRVKKKTNGDLFDWVLLIILFIGTILLGGSLISSLLSFEGLVQAFLLWFTAIVVLRYTKETYHLKKIGQKELAVLGETEMNKFLPILRASGSSWSQVGEYSDIQVDVHNIGKGVARRVFLCVEGERVYGPITIEVDSGQISKRLRIQNLPSPDKLLVSGRNKVSLELQYEDLYGRLFFTHDFFLIPRERILETENWKFGRRKRIE